MLSTRFSSPDFWAPMFLEPQEHGNGATPGITEDCKWWNIVRYCQTAPIITRALKPALPNKIIVMRGEVVLSVALTCDQHS
jgi:hypothetical protein